jgi:hypothetical protein
LEIAKDIRKVRNEGLLWYNSGNSFYSLESKKTQI